MIGKVLNANMLDYDNAGDRECKDELWSPFDANLKKTRFLSTLVALQYDLGFGFSYTCWVLPSSLNLFGLVLMPQIGV